MNRHLSRCLIFVVLLAVNVSAGPQSTGIVKGAVTADSGPVVGARVVISSGSDSRYNAIATTDEEGAFTFANTPLGEVEVKVYDPQEQLLASGRGTLKEVGEVITIPIRVP
jgi:Carboxypeptidase regulatory-like domain